MTKRVMAVCVLLALSGCGGSDTGDSGTPATSAAARSPKVHTVDELKGALLAASDMPSGFAEEENQATEDDEGLCGRPPLSKQVPPAAKAEILFAGGSFGPFFAEALASFGTDAEAERYMSTFKADSTSCTSYPDPTESDPNAKTTLAALSFPKIADETQAIRMKGSATLDMVFVRRNNVVMMSAYGGLTNDPVQLEALTRKADAKVAELK